MQPPLRGGGAFAAMAVWSGAVLPIVSDDCSGRTWVYALAPTMEWVSGRYPRLL
jgi:predicted phage tail protein